MELRLAYGHIMACVACTSYRWADITCLVYVSSAHPPSFAILQRHLICTLWPFFNIYIYNNLANDKDT